MKKFYGIDLGTTYSCIAYVNEYGATEVVPNKEGMPTTPSVVAFESDTYSVGESAKNSMEVDPDLVCSTIKRHMGETDYFFPAFGKEYTPETISSFILKKLVEDANEKLGEEVKDVVITCPAYFGEDEKNATKKAGELAGLNVIQLLNEPTAAAISYGIKTNEPQTILVYDLGGGTFDITVLCVEDDNIRTRVTGGDHKLGGKDWDKKIIDHVVSKYCEATGDDPDDLYSDNELMGDLALKAEKSKMDLSNRQSTVIKLNGEKVEITREQFEQMTSDLLESTIMMTRKLMEEARDMKGISAFDKILLVGGSTYMPQVAERIKNEFPNIPVEFCDPNQSVAKGAAIFALNQVAFSEINDLDKEEIAIAPEQKKEIQNNPIFKKVGGTSAPLTIIDVISSSIGMKLICEDDVERVVNIVYKNTEYPCEVPYTVGTVVPNQTTMNLQIYENRSLDEYPDESGCKQLTTGELGPLPAGLPVNEPVELLFKIDKQGTLSLDAIHKPSGVSKHLEVQFINHISEEELERQRQNIKQLRRI